MKDRDGFAADRLTGIGGSDAAAAVGVSPWRTPYDLYLEKIGESQPLPASEPMRWGTLLEDIILDEYSRVTGRAIGRDMPMIRHPDYTWMTCHMDARELDTDERIIEAKTSRRGAGWGEPGTDQIPQYYLVQAHHNLIVAKAQVCDVPVLIGGNEFRIYEVRVDPEIDTTLIDAEQAFWRCVVEHVPPPPLNTEDAVRRWGGHAHPGDVFATEDEMEAINTLRQCRFSREHLDGLEEIARTKIMKRLSDLGDTLVDLAGTPLATWKLDNGRKGYTVEPRKPSRRFLLKE